jgi:hypothetical protein
MGILDDILKAGKTGVIAQFPAYQRAYRSQMGAVDLMLNRIDLAKSKGYAPPAALVAGIREHRGKLAGLSGQESTIANHYTDATSKAIADGRLSPNVIKAASGLGAIPILVWLASIAVAGIVAAYIASSFVAMQGEIMAKRMTLQAQTAMYSQQLATWERNTGADSIPNPPPIDPGSGGGSIAGLSPAMLIVLALGGYFAYKAWIGRN